MSDARLAMPPLLPLSPHTVRVWMAPLHPGAGPEALAACLAELEPWERAECAQLRTLALRQAYLATGATNSGVVGCAAGSTIDGYRLAKRAAHPLQHH